MDLGDEHSGARRGAAAPRRSGGQIEKPEKPCLACTDFKSWVKVGTDSTKTKAAPVRRTECPADKNELGRASWNLLHTMSVYLPEKELSLDQQSDVKTFVETFSRLYPCEYCAEDMRKDIKETPIVTQTGKDFSMWLCGLHNTVNKKLEKPAFDCSRIYERWREGWKDGSCDPPS